MPENLAGQVAVVTGSGRGFGRAIAQGLAAAGARVMVSARTQFEIDETARLIDEAGGSCAAAIADVTRREDIERLRATTESELGPVDLVIHNAGVPWPFGPIWYVDPDRWWEAQEIHVRAAMYLIHEFVPPMIERGGGRFVAITSAAGVRVRPNVNGYGVAKSTQIRVAQYLAKEGAPHNIRAFACHPGNVLTGISDLTMADPDAQKYAPDFVETLSRRKEEHEDGSEGLRECAVMCERLASGRYDGLSGRYLTPTDDLDALLAEGAIVDESALALPATS